MENASQKPFRHICLQAGPIEFFEVSLNKSTFKVVFIQGELIEGKKNLNNIQIGKQDYPSYYMAELYVLGLINEKLDEGFELISDEEYDDPFSDGIKEDERFDTNQIQVVEEFHHQGFDQEAMILQELDDIKFSKKEVSNEYEEEKIGNERDLAEGFIQKEFKLSSFMKDQVDRIEEQAERFRLLSETINDRLIINGQKEDIFKFLEWLYAQTVEKTEDELSKLKYGKIMKKHEDYQQIELTLSTFHRMNQKDIFAKADELKLIYDFAYDMLLVSGYLDSLKEFRAYLQEVEAIAKKSLYPKYWDFYNVDKFSEINVPEGTIEYLEVSDLFSTSLKGMKITKLTRIQNKYLMDNFITMLQKRQEYKNEVNTSRKLLFHGSRTIKPGTIYEESDTGFDLQFSKSTGKYGKGIYFAANSSYSHKYAYKLDNGSYQIFLADVFIGKPMKVNASMNLVKAPPGYDSVESIDSFYIIYNNFHSYPLYLIEYAEDFN